jgi:hypothetical protein
MHMLCFTCLPRALLQVLVIDILLAKKEQLKIGLVEKNYLDPRTQIYPNTTVAFSILQQNENNYWQEFRSTIIVFCAKKYFDKEGV